MAAWHNEEAARDDGSLGRFVPCICLYLRIHHDRKLLELLEFKLSEHCLGRHHGHRLKTALSRDVKRSRVDDEGNHAFEINKLANAG